MAVGKSTIRQTDIAGETTFGKLVLYQQSNITHARRYNFLETIA